MKWEFSGRNKLVGLNGSVKEGRLTKLGFISVRTDQNRSCVSSQLKTFEQDDDETGKEMKEDSDFNLMLNDSIEAMRNDSLTRDVLIIIISLCLICCICFTAIQCVKYCCRSQAQIKPKE